jgi:acyl-CoA synthetase (AMP-forming)/AMP-acid ligase II
MTINYDDRQEPFNKFSTLVELLRYRASTQPERIAYIFLRDGETKETRLTYGELDQKARAIAQ